jgi:hypothetical protein
MDMHAQLTVVVVQKMLSVRLGVAQPAPVDQTGSGGEATLGAVYRETPTGEELTVTGGESVDRVSLWHGKQR